MIIVEGFDASGKSTLATEIGKAKKWPVVHTGGPTRDAQDVICCLHRSRMRMTQLCVQDRITHISEAAYSALRFPKKAAWAFAALPEIGPPVCVVYCRPPTKTMIDALVSGHTIKEYDTDEHITHVIKHAEQIIMLYDTIMEIVAQRNRVVVHDRTHGYHATQSAIKTAVEWHK